MFDTFYTCIVGRYTVHFQINPRDTIRVVTYLDDGPDGVTRFEAGPYRPGMGVRSEASQAYDVCHFAMSYVERPEEFDRFPYDTEQGVESAAWWRNYGDAVACECGDEFE
jgi:hypothetical protein